MLSANTGITFTWHVALASPTVAVMSASPTDLAYTSPFEATVATFVLLLFHSTEGIVPSEELTVILNLYEEPLLSSRLVG